MKIEFQHEGLWVIVEFRELLPPLDNGDDNGEYDDINYISPDGRHWAPWRMFLRQGAVLPGNSENAAEIELPEWWMAHFDGAAIGDDADTCYVAMADEWVKQVGEPKGKENE